MHPFPTTLGRRQSFRNAYNGCLPGDGIIPLKVAFDRWDQSVVSNIRPRGTDLWKRVTNCRTPSALSIGLTNADVSLHA